MQAELFRLKMVLCLFLNECSRSSCHVHLLPHLKGTGQSLCAYILYPYWRSYTAIDGGKEMPSCMQLYRLFLIVFNIVIFCSLATTSFSIHSPVLKCICITMRIPVVQYQLNFQNVKHRYITKLALLSSDWL